MYNKTIKYYGNGVTFLKLFYGIKLKKNYSSELVYIYGIYRISDLFTRY